MVPPKTQAWLTEANRVRTGAGQLRSNVVAGPDWEPVISTDHHLQVTAVVASPHGSELELILWNLPHPPQAGELAVRYKVEGSSSESNADVLSIEPASIPPDVRKELVGYGFTRPPMEATWLKVQVAIAATSGTDVSLTVDSTSLHTSVRFLVR